jgi:hypothetical protein
MVSIYKTFLDMFLQTLLKYSGLKLARRFAERVRGGKGGKDLIKN